MLTTDLIRARLRQGVLRPSYLKVACEERLAEASELIAIFQRHVGLTLGELNEAVAELIGDETDFMTRRGLVKLLMDRTETRVDAERAPEEIRWALFELAAEQGPVGTQGGIDRGIVVKQVAAKLGLEVSQVERGMYADLKDASVIDQVDLPTAEGLLQRYNLALAQAVLFKATEVRITLSDARPAHVRALFRMIKFHRLMHRATKAPSGEWNITLDGPLSLFKQTQRYGIQLALFLPQLCHCAHWSLEADVHHGPQKRPAQLRLSDKTGLVSHTRPKGTWESDEERHFRAQFNKRKGAWRLRRCTRIVDLDGQGVLVPDYVLTHEDGREALLELVWFWRRRGFMKRVELLKAHGPPNLIIALASRLNTGDEALDVLPNVVPFKGVIIPKHIIACAERVTGAST